MKVQFKQPNLIFAEPSNPLPHFNIALDESNIQPCLPGFTVFGAFALPTSNLIIAKKRIQKIKAASGFPLSTPLKYNFKKTSEFGLNFEREFLVTSLIDSLNDLGVKFFFNAIYSEIMSSNINRSLEMNISITMATAEDFLLASNANGTLILDHMKYLPRSSTKTIFDTGIEFPKSKKQMLMRPSPHRSSSKFFRV